jgi:2-polyprenyl-3-methyl-5-hydroxy-6-metoxy-1,4-benzoquinol methylase
MNNFNCRICGNSTNNKTYIAREMMFGFRDEFEYFQCSKCGCLQIVKAPDNLSKYYPNKYYSYSIYSKNSIFKELKFRLNGPLIKYRLGKLDFIGYIISHFSNNYHWVIKNLMDYNSRVLDIGCGNGKRLFDLNKLGFKHLTGIDPYINQELSNKNGITILKKEIYDIKDKFDIIMMHHTFEHLENPKSVFKKVYDNLNHNSYFLVCTPVANCFAFRKYGVNWVQLDAPRHLFLHTTTSIKLLAKETGFKVNKIIYDSASFQFTGSERYQNGISLFETYKFSKKQMKYFKKETKRLNNNNDGDSACFYLYKE